VFDRRDSSQREQQRRQSIIDNAKKNYDDLNLHQKHAVDSILDAVHGTSIQRCFFLDGPGGTGKTFVYNTLCGLLAADNLSVIAVAWTGIAANLLLIGGRTVHSQFKLPLNLTAYKTCNIKTKSQEADTIRRARLIIWDEAPMAPGSALSAINICLQDVMRNKEPFGGKVIVLGGDFRQCLPVIRHGCRSAYIKASLKHSALWIHFEPNIIRLTTNMRTGVGAPEFAKWLLELGDGKHNNDDNINLSGYSESCVTKESLVTELFGHKVDTTDTKKLASRVILCPLNEDTFDINDEVVQLIDGDEHVYESVDTVNSEDGEDINNFPTEYLYSLTPTGLPPHILKLRKGVIIMLLRNLNISKGLCNGTRLTVVELRRHVLRCHILTGQRASEDNDILIPRITLSSDDSQMPFKLCRRQFPVRVAFAMTINKAQGQTFDRVGLLLRQPVFSHGQLYVAFSRVRKLEDIKVKIEHGEAGMITKNVIYREILS